MSEVDVGKGLRMCHFTDSGNKTIRDIMRWSVMECDDADLAVEIQRLGSKLSLLISGKCDKADVTTSTPKKILTWGLFKGEDFYAAYTHDTEKEVIEDCLQYCDFLSWGEAVKAGYAVKKIEVTPVTNESV